MLQRPCWCILLHNRGKAEPSPSWAAWEPAAAASPRSSAWQTTLLLSSLWQPQITSRRSMQGRTASAGWASWLTAPSRERPRSTCHLFPLPPFASLTPEQHHCASSHDCMPMQRGGAVAQVHGLPQGWARVGGGGGGSCRAGAAAAGRRGARSRLSCSHASAVLHSCCRHRHA